MIWCGVWGRTTAAAVLAAIAAVISGHALIEAATSLARGDTDGAARWFTLSFFAGIPLIAAYAALRARFTRPSWPLLAIAVIAIGLQGVLALGSFFAGDDWIHIVRAHDEVAGGGLPDSNYLGHVVFIHYAPGLRLGYWLLQEVAPLDWAAGLAGLLVLFGGSIVLLGRILRMLYGERRTNLLLLLLFGTSILLVTSFLWFADGLHKLPSTFLSLLAVDAYLTYWRTRSKLALALSVVAVALGSLFYVKVLLVPMYLLLIRLLFLEDRPRRALKIVWAERWAWLAYAPPLGLYLWNYLANYASTRPGPSPSLDLLGNYLWLNWFKGVTPALAGVEVGPQAARSGALFATIAQLALIGVICLSVHLKRSAWRAWLFWGIAFCANATLVGLGRLGTMGLERVGQELRYDTEMAWLLPLALGFAFFPGRVAARPAPALRVRFPWTTRPRVRMGAALAVCAYLIAAAATGAGISSSWREKNSGPGKAYVENIRDDVGRLVRGGHRPLAIDDQLPAFLIGSADHPLNRLERLMPVVEPRLRVVVAAARPLQVGDDGHVGAARLQPLVRGAGALDGAGRLRVAGGGSGGGRCLVGERALRFTSKPMLTGQSLYALVSYDVARGVGRPGAIAAAGSPGSPGAVPLDRPRGHELVNLGRSLTVTLPAGARACVDSLAVGWLGSNGR